MVCALLVASPAAARDRPLSDEQKRAVVYEMYRDYKSDDFPDVPDMSPQSAMSLAQANSVVFVDTRSIAEMAVSMLPDAISRAAFLDNIDRYRGKTIVAYCTISYRSGLFVKEQADRGLTIYNLEGGMLAWVLEGGKVFDHGVETRRIHVYGDKWNYAPSGYEAVTFGFFERLSRWLY